MLLNYDSYFFFLGWTSKLDQVKASELMTSNLKAFSFLKKRWTDHI